MKLLNCVLFLRCFSFVSNVVLLSAADPTTPKVQFEAAFQGKCGLASPCEHLCFELHDGMFECDCRDGFILHENGYSCNEVNNTIESTGDEILYQKDASFSAELLDISSAESAPASYADSLDGYQVDQSEVRSEEGKSWSSLANKVTFVSSKPYYSAMVKKATGSSYITDNNSDTRNRVVESQSYDTMTTTQSPNLEQKLPAIKENGGNSVIRTTESLSQTSSTASVVVDQVWSACPLECGVGQCIVEPRDDGYTYRCRCPLGRTGHRCQQESEIRTPRIVGNGWVALPPLRDAYMDVQLSVEFRPEAWDGILMLTGEGDDLSGDFLALFLHEGFVEFRFDCGSGLGLVRSTEPILIHQWNRLTIYRHRWDAWLHLNSGKHSHGRSKGLFSRITFREPVFVGGPGNMSSVLEKLPTADGFKGCIRHFEINNHVYNLNLEPKGDALKGLDIEECSSDLCSRVPCQHGGKCVSSTPDAAVCLCPMGYMGELCQTPVDLQVPSFNGSSYLKYPGLGASVLSWLDIEMTFKPNTLDGVMIYNGYRADGVGDFMAIYLFEGYMEFAFDLGTGSAVLRSSEPVSMGEWHRVQLSRTGRLAVLQVDSQEASHLMTPGAFTQLSLPMNMYVGGVPTQDMVSPKVKTRTSFVGCIQKIVVNGKPLKILAAALSGVNIDNCAHPCVAEPCAHGGVCVPNMDYFSCECPLGFKDSHCQTRIWNTILIPKFLGDSYLHYTDVAAMKRLEGGKFQINMRFQISSRNGLLLWAGRKDVSSHSDYVAVGVKDGYLHLRYNLGSGEVVLVNNVSRINDGKWHRVKALRNEQIGSVIVDNGPAVTSNSPGKLCQLNVNNGLYIGGMEDITHLSLSKYESGIIGCISEVNLGTDYHLDLVSQATSGRNVDHCD